MVTHQNLKDVIAMIDDKDKKRIMNTSKEYTYIILHSFNVGTYVEIKLSSYSNKFKTNPMVAMMETEEVRMLVEGNLIETATQNIWNYYQDSQDSIVVEKQLDSTQELGDTIEQQHNIAIGEFVHKQVAWYCINVRSVRRYVDAKARVQKVADQAVERLNSHSQDSQIHMPTPDRARINYIELQHKLMEIFG